MNSEATNLLKDLVAIPSYVGNNPRYETDINAYLKRYFKANFPSFKVHTLPFEGSRENLVFLGSNSPRVIFACHTDTTPISSSTQLQLVQSKDKAIGLGTKDMKGGIVSSLLSLPMIENLSKVALVFYGDEEYQQRGMAKLVKSLPALLKVTPQLVISPESRFNVGYGSRGIIVLKLSIKGKTAHSARPHLGIDAIKQFYELITSLEKQFSKNTELGITSFAITRVEGGSEANGGEIIDNVGSIPDKVNATISVRNALPSLSGITLVQAIKRLAKRMGLQVVQASISTEYPARVTNLNLIKRIKKIIETEAGKEVELGDPKTAGYNDAALLGTKLNCPVINFGPYGEANHTPNEWVSLTSIEKAAKVLAAVVNKI